MILRFTPLAVIGSSTTPYVESTENSAISHWSFINFK